MKTENDSPQLLNYPFDLYQRTRDIREIVEIISQKTGKEKLRILDVGGYRVEAEDRDDLLLREFLPQHEIIALDMIPSSISGYVQGDGTALPFKDKSFDVVVTSDVYEHVLPEGRNAFVENLLRVSGEFVILGAPFYSVENTLAEKIIFEFIRKVLHSEHTQLKEHIENRLPDADELASLIKNNGRQFISFSSGNRDRWVFMMLLKHYLMSIPDTKELDTMLDRYYNMSLYESDHSGQGYRTVFVISSQEHDKNGILEAVQDHFKTYSENINPVLDKTGMEQIRMLIDLEALRTRALIDQKDALIQHQAQQIQTFQQMKSTKVYKIMQFFNSISLSPVIYFGRKVLGKMQQAWMVIRGKRRHPFLSISEKAYRRWIKKTEPSPDMYPQLREQAKHFTHSPLLSIVVPAYNTPQEYLAKACESVLNQVYPNWELCIVNDGSPQKHVRETLDRFARKDSRIKVKHLPRNKGISRATNEAIALAAGQFIVFMDSDDVLHPLALYEVVKFLNQNPEADFIFSDEDKMTLGDVRRRPEFKPGWNPDLFLTYNYLNHLTVCRKIIVDEVGGFRAQYNWSQDYDLYLRITEKTSNIHHIPLVLYHWREIPNSSASKVDVRPEAQAKCMELLTETLKRRGINAVVKKGLRPSTFKIKKK